MKKLIILSTIMFSVMFSSPSFADWKKGAKGTTGNTYYIDFDSLRKHNGYVYYWSLTDLLKPIDGNMSAKIYFQGDCKLSRKKVLTITRYKEPMGGGPRNSFTPTKPIWEYNQPGSAGEAVLKRVCAYAK
jgi:hypothetical protein